MSKRLGVSFLILLFAVIFQTLFPSFLRPWGIFPDLPTMFLILFAIHSGWKEIQVVAFLIGLIQDFLSDSPIGFYAVTALIISVIFGLLKDKMDLNNFVFPFMLGFLGTIVRSLVVYALVFWFPFEVASYTYSFLAWQFWVMCAINAFILPLLFFAFLRIRFFKKLWFQDRM